MFNFPSSIAATGSHVGGNTRAVQYRDSHYGPLSLHGGVARGLLLCILFSGFRSQLCHYRYVRVIDLSFYHSTSLVPATFLDMNIDGFSFYFRNHLHFCVGVVLGLLNLCAAGAAHMLPDTTGNSILLHLIYICCTFIRNTLTVFSSVSTCTRQAPG